MSLTLILASALAAQAPVAAGQVENVDVAYEALSEGRTNSALNDLEQIAADCKGDPAALINLGTAYARVGRLEKARECFEAAIASDDRYDLELADGRWVDSRRAARMALRQLPEKGAFASR